MTTLARPGVVSRSESPSDQPPAGETAGGATRDAGFVDRHVSLDQADVTTILDRLKRATLDALIDTAVPSAIRRDRPMDLPEALSETQALAALQELADENRVLRSLIGQGYHGTITPPAIRRAILENPLWYTPYTPYQAEISQGRLEALLNFQTMVTDLTGLPLAGASLLDEATAAAEAMAMCVNLVKGDRRRFLVASDCHPQTIAVVETRGRGAGIDVVIGSLEDLVSTLGDDVCGVLVQYPATDGYVGDHRAVVEQVHGHGGLVVAATDPLACVLLEPPGAWGADIVVGSTQRFGMPMGFGGPHAAFLACRESHARKMPGRLVGVSKDTAGRRAYRLSLQTREQHIRRDKATSNICTAQVLPAVVASMYAVYHGPQGLRQIATRVHTLANTLAGRLVDAGLELANDRFFDTVSIQLGQAEAQATLARAAEAGFNLRIVHRGVVNVCLDELTTEAELDQLEELLAGSRAVPQAPTRRANDAASPLAYRTSDFLTHPTFHRYHTEHELLRYTTRLIQQDYGLAHGMIPLGSCTMKLNAAAEMLPITWRGFTDVHPLAPAEQTRGYRRLIEDVQRWLCTITGFDAVSLQPNAGSQGEFAGLLAIKAFHDQAREAGGSDVAGRDVCLIPTSAHGTNPASAVMAGMRVVPIQCRDNGDIDLEDLTAKAEQHADRLAALMVTYPSTHGVFEAGIRDICKTVHRFGGKVYMDGANMNAQVGLTSPAECGADVCHLNLHKTFCIPHGGGGPGVGPVACTAELAPYLPSDFDPDHVTPRLSAAAGGSPLILTITWMYIRMMGSQGLTDASRHAILAANDLAHRLAPHYDILFTGEDGTVAHEFVLDLRPFQKSAGVTVEDVAKRLMDYGFHAPTMSWPVAGTLMVEPTESESLAELDRFVEAMISIRHEIAQVEAGDWPQDNNPLKHAPHVAADLLEDDWTRPYPRRLGAFPLAYQREPGRKFWPAVSRIDQAHGDRHLVCTCPSVDAYAQ